MKIITITQDELAQRVARQLRVPFCKAIVTSCADGEIIVTLPSDFTCEQEVVVIVQSTGPPVHEHTLGVAFLAQQLKQAGAFQVIAVIPYLGYSRQERMAHSSQPGHAQIIAHLFEGAGIDRLITLVLHADRILDFFSIPVTVMSADDLIVERIKRLPIGDKGVCLVAPDKGATRYVAPLSALLGYDVLVCNKKRETTHQISLTAIEGTCVGTVAIVVDDIIATGHTAVTACRELKERGFVDCYAFFVHPVLVPQAIERLKQGCYQEIWVTNSLPLTHDQQLPVMHVLDIAPLITSTLQKIEADHVQKI